MKAIVRDSFGSPDVLQLREVERPEITADGVLVRVRAASVNRADWYVMAGRPYAGRAGMGLRKPKSRFQGADFAGTVEAVGKDVTDFRPGDEVFGASGGAFAEYVCVTDVVARKPANVTFEEAAAVPIAGLTALQGLRDHAELQPGQKVLVNGASGGVGTFAVQVAKALGGEVTAVCSSRNVDQARLLGADRVIDYTREDFTKSGGAYDVLFDNAGSKPWRACRRVLAPHATVLLVGGSPKNRVFGPLAHMASMRLWSLGSGRRTAFFVAKMKTEDLDALRELIEAGKVKPVIDRRYDLSETPDALRYMGEGHARGKVVIAV